MGLTYKVYFDVHLQSSNTPISLGVEKEELAEKCISNIFKKNDTPIEDNARFYSGVVKTDPPYESDTTLQTIYSDHGGINGINLVAGQSFMARVNPGGFTMLCNRYSWDTLSDIIDELSIVHTSDTVSINGIDYSINKPVRDIPDIMNGTLTLKRKTDSEAEWVE